MEITVKIKVPDGNFCDGCNYFHRMQMGGCGRFDACTLFFERIVDMEKCDECLGCGNDENWKIAVCKIAVREK
jgi:hypothetical protein